MYKGVISACLKISGNVGNIMELLKLLQKKLLKISLFYFTTFTRLSKLCDALFTSSFKISLKSLFVLQKPTQLRKVKHRNLVPLHFVFMISVDDEHRHVRCHVRRQSIAEGRDALGTRLSRQMNDCKGTGV